MTDIPLRTVGTHLTIVYILSLTPAAQLPG